MLNPYTQMQSRFAGMKPSCDVRNAMAQTIKLFTIAISGPVPGFSCEQYCRHDGDETRKYNPSGASQKPNSRIRFSYAMTEANSVRLRHWTRR